MNVWLVVWWLDRFGGMERHVTELACALRRAGLKVTVFSIMPRRTPNPFARQLKREGVRLICAPFPLWIANGLRLAICRFLPMRLATEWARRDWLREQLLKSFDRESSHSPADLMHIHSCRLGQAWLAPWAKHRGIPCIYTEHVAITEMGGPILPDGATLVLAASRLACVSLAFAPRPAFAAAGTARHRHLTPHRPRIARRRADRRRPLQHPLPLAPLPPQRNRRSASRLCRCLPQKSVRPSHACRRWRGSPPVPVARARIASPTFSTFAGLVPADQMPRLLAQADLVGHALAIRKFCRSPAGTMAARKPVVPYRRRRHSRNHSLR